jgi:hypothetical protein
VVRHDFLLWGCPALFLSLYRNAPEKERDNMPCYNTITIRDLPDGGGAGRDN